MVSTINDAGISEADYQKIQEEGQLTTATITDIEEQTNISINEEHPSIISYEYSTGQGELIGIYRSLDPEKVDQMKVGSEIQIQYLNEHSMIVGLDKEPFCTISTKQLQERKCWVNHSPTTTLC